MDIPAAGDHPRDQPPSGWRPPLRDIAIAVVLTVIAVFAAYGEAHPHQPGRYFTGPQQHLPHTPTAALLLVVAAGAVLAWRHRYPRTVLCCSAAAVIAYTLPGYVNGVALLLPAVALGTLAARLPVRKAVAWAVALTAVLMAIDPVNNPLGPTGGGFILIPANNAVALFAGIAISNRRALVTAARRQAAQEAERDTQRRIDEERLRIARELHDVVAHTMATITVQAAAASQLLRDHPERAAESLQAIRAAGKDGLRELRAILNVLRNAGEEADPTAPVPGLARLDALTAGVRAAGLPVTVTVAGQPRSLPAVTDLAAYRIIQEALTNTIRHAGPATARVLVDYADDELRVEITDTGRGPVSSAAEAAFAALARTDAELPAPDGQQVRADLFFPRPAALDSADDQASGNGHAAANGLAGAGHGLRGMRERAAAANGSIEIGRAASSGGFRVAARFPLQKAGS